VAGFGDIRIGESLCGVSMVELRLAEVSQVPASYTIYKKGTTYYAKSWIDGGMDFSGTDAATVVDNATSVMSPGERIVVKGNIDFANPVNITKHIVYDHYGIATITGTGPYLKVDIGTDSVSKLRIHVQGIADSGASKTRNGIELHSVAGGGRGRISFGSIWGCLNGILLTSVKNDTAASIGDMFVEGTIYNCTRGIYFDAPPANEVHREGLHFKGNMFSNNDGILIDTGTTRCGAIVLDGVIDNATVGGSWDFRDLGKQSLPHILGGKFIRTDKIRSRTWFEIRTVNAAHTDSLDGPRSLPLITGLWTQRNLGNAGSATFSPVSAALTTAAIAVEDGIQFDTSTSFFTNRTNRFVFRTTGAGAGVNQQSRVGLANGLSAFLDTDLINGIQIKWDGTSWKAICGDGITTQTVDTGIAVSDNRWAILNFSDLVVVYEQQAVKAEFTAAPFPTTRILAPFFNTKSLVSAAARSISIRQNPTLVYI